MSKLLLDEKPLMILPELAVKIGLNEAIALQQVHYWLKVYEGKESERHFRDGRWWVYNTPEGWQEGNFPFWSPSTIRRAFKSLRDKGILLTANYNRRKNDRTLWYSIDYQALAQVEQMACPKRSHGHGQDEHDDEAKMDEPLPETETPTDQPQNTPAAGAAENLSLPAVGACCERPEIYLADHETGRTRCGHCGREGFLSGYPPPTPPPDAPQADAGAPPALNETINVMMAANDPHRPRRVQRSRRKGAKLPPNTVDITGGFLHNMGDTLIEHISRLHSLEFSELWALVEPLKGKNLACWCPLTLPCHGDVWLELARLDKESLREWWAPCPTCDKPRATTRAHPTRDGLCQCAVEAFEREIDDAVGERAPAEGPEAARASGWREQVAQTPPNPYAEELERALRQFGDDAPAYRALVNQFAERFCLSPPWEQGAKKVGYWLKTLSDLRTAAGGDWSVIDEAGKRMEKARLTIAGPRSLINTTTAVVAERKKDGRKGKGTGGARPTEAELAQRQQFQAAVREKQARAGARAADE